MKNIILFLSCFVLFDCSAQEINHTVINSDIDNFWTAYDQIILEKDSAAQFKILEEEFLNKGTEGLKALMEKKQYSKEEYIFSITNYPSFWNSIRANTKRSVEFSEEIEEEIQKLKNIYPDLRPANIYFAMGTLRTGGTAHDGHVLIGSELALADSTAVTTDIQPKWLGDNLSNYFKSNPIDDVVLLNVHEYVHTQQSNYGYDLLSQCIYEGVAEFASLLSHGGESVAPAMAYGRKNSLQVRARFENEVFSPHWNDWLYNNSDNEFGHRDMGYYIGYSICEAYYDRLTDKTAAIKTMIELDYQNAVSIEKFANKSGYFSKSIAALKENYIATKPKITKVAGLVNGSQNVDPRSDKITLHFSHVMSDRFRNQRLGPLGVDYLLPVSAYDWSEDRKSITLTIDLEANRRYQLEIDDQYRSQDGPVLDKYLIDFRTAKYADDDLEVK